MYITQNKLNSDISEWSTGSDHISTKYWKWDKLVSNEDCDKIISLGEKIGLKGGTVRDSTTIDNKIRDSLISWLAPEDAPWVYDLIWDAANHQPWDYDIRGFGDNLQYTVYRGEDRHYYHWHSDTGPKMQHRKVSFTLELSDPDEYKGGHFEFISNDGSPIRVPPFGKGSAIIFPSFIRHRITPVTKGIRKSLVTWVSGPKFR